MEPWAGGQGRLLPVPSSPHPPALPTAPHPPPLPIPHRFPFPHPPAPPPPTAPRPPSHSLPSLSPTAPCSALPGPPASPLLLASAQSSLLAASLSPWSPPRAPSTWESSERPPGPQVPSHTRGWLALRPAKHRLLGSFPPVYGGDCHAVSVFPTVTQRRPPSFADPQHAEAVHVPAPAGALCSPDSRVRTCAASCP